MAAGAAQAARKRNRKRKRRNVSSSSSSSSDSTDASSENESTAVRHSRRRHIATKALPSSSSSSDPSSSSESESAAPSTAKAAVSAAADSRPADPSLEIPARKKRVDSPSPLQNVSVPNVLNEEKEQPLETRFRQFWMSSVADAFADDLNEIRKESNLTPARLALLIDSLASGADVYASSKNSDGKQTNDMKIIIGE